MQAGITSQYGFLYQRYVFIKIVLDNVGMDKFFTYEGVDDIDFTKIDKIVSISISRNTFYQVKSGTVTRDCLAKIIGNWLLIDNSFSNYKVILENELPFNINDEEVVNGVCNYFFEGNTKKSNSISNKVYKKYIENRNNAEIDFRETILNIISKITYEVIPMETLKEHIIEVFKSVYCSDIKIYELAKNCRCDRFLNYINKEINEAIEKKKNYTLKFPNFINIIDKVSKEINDRKYIVDISDIKKRKKALAETLMNKKEFREVRQLKLVNSNNSFVVNELIKELLYKDLREIYFNSDKTLISNIEENAFSNYEDAKNKLPEDSDAQKLFYETMEKYIPLSIVNDSLIYRQGCYTYLTSDEIDEDKQITWGQENE